MPTATRVLYAGHSEDSVTTVSESLTESLPEFSITTAIEPDTVLEAVDDDRVDCVCFWKLQSPSLGLIGSLINSTASP